MRATSKAGEYLVSISSTIIYLVAYLVVWRRCMV